MESFDSILTLVEVQREAAKRAARADLYLAANDPVHPGWLEYQEPDRVALLVAPGRWRRQGAYTVGGMILDGRGVHSHATAVAEPHGRVLLAALEGGPQALEESPIAAAWLSARGYVLGLEITPAGREFLNRMPSLAFGDFRS